MGDSVCTRVLWNNNDLGVLCGRTMDWPESTEPVLTVAPRGYPRHGGKVDPLDEKGLGAHALYLKSTGLPERDPARPALQIALWAQYLLDNAATVDEAIALMSDVQLTMVESHGHQATVHLAVEDADGDSAIMENIGGELILHHGPQYRLMTNDPRYEDQLALLDRQDF